MEETEAGDGERAAHGSGIQLEVVGAQPPLVFLR